MTDACICMNAWYECDCGDVHYSDQVNDPIHGWGVYRRIPDPRGDHWPYDTADERDFDTEAEARTYANELAAKHGLEVREY